MKKCMGKNFLLETKTAKILYHEIASNEPIFDYHCHLIPRQIAENTTYENLTEMWLGGDHYKWRAMRTVGIPEQLITGDADPYDKFFAWASTLPQYIGNPLYHWSHLELQRYFGITKPLNEKTAPAIWKMSAEILQSKALTVAEIFKKFSVYAVGTTDDPADDLYYHRLIGSKSAPIGDITTKVLPSFRPDKALLLQDGEFSSYLDRLGAADKREITSVSTLCDVLAHRLEYFVSCGCVASDHGIPMVPSIVGSDQQVEEIFQKAKEKKPVTLQEAQAYQTHILHFLAKEYAKHGIVMQLHMNAMRNLNGPKYRLLGPDTGFDAASDLPMASALSRFLGYLEAEQALPKTIIYTLNPKDYYVIGTTMGAFQQEHIPGKMQLGSGWWFCDHKDGMEEQLKVLANVGSLPRFVGMLTDSRSLLSYPRHEYFRRILCNLLGNWVERGEIHSDIELLTTVVKDVSFGNALRYFSLASR